LLPQQARDQNSKEHDVTRPTIDLGYEVGTGSPVTVPLHHTVITGQTQMAGKTTTLEAMISRSGLRALTFVTKRGEGSFTSARRIEPYFREQADWQFVASILEASRGEKLKFERAWIIRASKGAKTLADVQRNVQRLMKDAKGMSADVYLTLDAYLEAVVPQIAGVKWATSVQLAAGVNVMDLSALVPEMQHLVIRSAITWVLDKEKDTVVVVPEAWKFLPQGRGTPVKLAAESYIRQAAGLHNYLWLDSQDIAGVEKIILKSVPVWILGVQREANEVKRTLDQIPAGIKKPKPDQVATLGLGQFFACHGTEVKRVYVQPVWMNDAQARQVADGSLPVDVASKLSPRPEHVVPFTATQLQACRINPPAKPQPESEPDMSQVEVKLDKLITLLTAQQQPQPALLPHVEPPAGIPAAVLTGDEESLYQRFKARLLKESPEILQVLLARPEIHVKVERHVIEAGGDTLRGRLALLIRGGFFDEPKSTSAALKELARKGHETAPPNVYRELDALASMGFLTIEGGENKTAKRYASVLEMKGNLKEKS
jgi:hypothetical protein